MSFHSSYAQYELYVGGEIIGGVLGGSDLKSNLLKQRNYSPTVGGQISASVRIFDIIALEAGIGQHWSRVRLTDNNFEEQAQDFSIKIKNSSYHWNYYGAISGFYKIRKTDSYLYGKFAVSLNTFGAKTVSGQSSFSISSLNIDRTLDYTTSYNQTNYSFIPEIGFQHKFFKGNLLSIGLRYNIGQTQAFESDYTVTDNLSQQSSTDGLTSTGNAFAFTVGYNIRLLHFNKKEKVKKLKLEKMAIDVSKKEEKKDTVIPVPQSDRKIVISDRIKVETSRVIISIWDHQTVDGDRISLLFNDKWIVENYELKKEKYEIIVELQEGINTFVLHALNLGDIKPNTAALLVDDGHKKRRIVLQSNMKKSGTLQIKYKNKNASK